MSEESTPVTVYVSIGNSDDKLTQAEWAEFVTEVASVINAWSQDVHGRWLSASDSRWQNACWCVQIPAEYEQNVRSSLAGVREKYRQDSVAWAVAPRTEFL